ALAPRRSHEAQVPLRRATSATSPLSGVFRGRDRPRGIRRPALPGVRHGGMRLAGGGGGRTPPQTAAGDEGAPLRRSRRAAARKRSSQSDSGSVVGSRTFF